MEKQAIEQGEALLKKADEKMNTFFLWRNADSYSDAARFMTQAAAQFKIAKQYKRAGDIYMQASNLYSTKTQDRLNDITALVEAANVYKLCDVSQAAKCYEAAARAYMATNRFSQAAKNWNDLASLQENELFDRKAAVEAYLQCSECYKLSNSKISSFGALSKAAPLRAADGDLEGAIKLFEELASLYAKESSASMHHNVNKNCYSALICSMALEAQQGVIEMVDTQERLTNYQDIYPTFQDHDDATLIQELLDAYQTSDTKKYSQSLHNRKYKLDAWSMDLFYKVKRAMEGSATSPVGDDDAFVENQQGTEAPQESKDAAEVPDFT